jgi:hypothetical protein
MNIDDQLAYYEHRVKQGELEHSKAPPSIKQSIYDSKVLPYKQILRQVRLKAGLTVCWGDSACLAFPDSKCAVGQHETCKQHVRTTCILCESKQS